MKHGLAAEYFISDEIFDRESERIFDRHWLCVARSNDLHDGEFRTFSFERANLLLVRRGGKVLAFYNICRHRGAILCNETRGRVNNDCLKCSYHAWTYSTTGELLSAPNMPEDASWDKADYGLRCLPSCEWNGFVFVNFDDDAEPLERVFNSVVDKFDPWEISALEFAQVLQYDVKANWKLIFQNYSECYHCPTVHPALNRLTPYKSAGNDLVDGLVLGGPMALADDVETMSTDGKRVAEPLPGLSDEQMRLVSYYTVFPTMFISPHPDYVLVHRLERLSPSHTMITCELLFRNGNDEDHRRAVEFWDQTNRQDWHVCELVQQGAESRGYLPGPYSNLETVLPRFDALYLDAMG